MARFLLLLIIALINTAAAPSLLADEPAPGQSVTASSGAPNPEPPISYFLGASKVDVTPDHPVILSGYAARPHQLSLDVAQRLWARCIAIGSDEAGPAILMVVDNCGVSASVCRAVAAELERTHGIPRQRLTIASTHTHSAPMLTGVLNNLLIRDLNEAERFAVDRYTQSLVQNLVTAADEALRSRAEVKLQLTRGQVSFAINRRGTPVVDHELPLLVATAIDGQTKAVVTNYACHCVAAGSGPEISGDWAGFAAETIERNHGDAVALVLVGCGADQNPAQRGSLQAAEQQGKLLAEEVRRLMGQPLEPISGSLATSFAEISLPLDEPPTLQQWEARAEEQGIAGYHGKKNLKRLAQGESLPNEIIYPVQTWTFGDDLAMVFLGGEVVVDYAHLLRHKLDADRLWVTAYANDVACYIPSERILGEGGYEAGDAMVWYDQPSRLARGVEKLIIDEVQRQLGSSFATEHDATTTAGTRPLKPEASLAAMQTHQDLRVELVAAEPLVRDPVAIDFGHDGRLWVAEMHDYPEGMDGQYQPGGRIRFLEDTTGDGQYDRSTTFLEDVAFPTGVTVWRDGVLISAAPDVLYAEDTTGDGRADVVRKVLSGFHIENYQARVNSLSLGLDNWMYGAAGIFGGEVMTPGGQTVDAQNRDFRFRPDREEVEPVSGRTQQGRARDDWGNWFGCDNSTLLMHYPTTDHYHRRNPHATAPTPSQAIAASKELFPRGPLIQWALSGPAGMPTAACGLGIYRDNVLGEGYLNNTFTCEPVNQIVHRLQLSSHGLTFVGNRPADEQDREFLSSTDRWFRPVQARCGPDGALYIVDMHRFMIEHPRFLTAEARAGLNVRAGDQMGRIYRVVPQSFAPGATAKLAHMQTAQVVEAFGSANGTLRDMAHQQLLWRGDRSAVAALRRLAHDSPLPQVRLQAICVLDGFDSLDAEQVAARLRDEHPAVRRHAVRLAEKWLDNGHHLGHVLVELADDEDPQVRLQVAYSLGAWDHPAAGPALARMAEKHLTDPYIKTAIFSSLHAQNIDEVLRSAFELQNDHDSTHPLIEELLPVAVKLSDAETFSAIVGRVVVPRDTGHAQWQRELLPGLMQSLQTRQGELTDDQLAAYRSMLDQAFAQIHSDDAPEQQRIQAIRLLAHAATDGRHLATLSELFVPSTPLAVQQAAVETLAAIENVEAASVLFDAFARLTPSLQAMALDAAISRRTLAVELLSRLQSGELPRSMIGPAGRQTLTNHPLAEVKALAQTLFTTASNDEIAALIQSYKAVDPNRGEVAHGRELFVKHCAACHRADGVGHAVGPDLAALPNRSMVDLLTAILDPNQSIDARYATYTAVTTDGVLLTGIIESESGNSIRLKAQEGKQHQILRSELEQLQSTGVSLMPEGVAREIAPSDMEHLLAFLGAGGADAKYSYSDSGGPHLSYPDNPERPVLTDGHFGSEPFNDGSWIGLRHRDQRREHGIAFDFGKPIQINALQITYGVNHHPGGIRAPEAVTVRFSNDGESYSNPRVFRGLDDSPDGLGTLRIARRQAVVHLGGSVARYVRVDVTSDAEWTFLSELVFNPRVNDAHPVINPQVVDAALVVQQTPAEAPVSSVDQLADLLKGVAVGTDDEYRVIGELFRIAVQAGKRNDADELRGLLELSLPQLDEPLRDWQAVVVGGGVVNGISQSGAYPRERIGQIMGQHQDLRARWRRTLELSAKMAEDPAVRLGTRYDALRLIAMLPWDSAREPLTRHLAKDTPEELMQGAVSGLADIPHGAAAARLAKALGHLEGHLRELAVAGLVRVDGDTNYLLKGVENGRLQPGDIAADVRQALLEHPNAAVQSQARRLLGPD